MAEGYDVLLPFGLASFLGAAGLSYVYFKNQLHGMGDEIRVLEGQLTDLETQNEVARTQISQLSSRGYLQKRLAEGFIHMIPITDDRIARVSRTPESKAGNEVQAVANRGFVK